MAASDHLNKELFHGTNAVLDIGTILNPTTEGYGTDELHSFATTNPEVAEKSGRNIYRVVPVNNDLVPDPYNEDDSSNWQEAYSERPLNYSSRSGFRVIGRY